MSIYEAPVPLPKRTTSLCHECLRPIDATIYEKNGQIWMAKECP
ncbi:MAG: hypothetical protein ACXV2B_08900, partial [Halobacteriota archaeon]